MKKLFFIIAILSFIPLLLISFFAGKFSAPR